MSRKYFGTDGIRGTVGQAPITPDFVLRLAHAVGRIHDELAGLEALSLGRLLRVHSQSYSFRLRFVPVDGLRHADPSAGRSPRGL